MAANTMKNEGNGAGMIASVANLGSDAYEGIEEFNGQRRWIFIGLSVAGIGLILKSANGLLTVLTSECMPNSKFLAQALGFLEGRVALRIISIVTSWEFVLAIHFFESFLAIFIDNALQKWSRASVYCNDPDEVLKSTSIISSQEIRNKKHGEQFDSLNDAVGDLLE